MKNTEMKFLTYYNVFKLIQDNANLTRRDIQKTASLSWGTVSSVVNDLISYNLVKEKEKDVIVAGVHPKVLEVNDNDFFVLGININYEDLTIVLTDFSYRVKETYSTIPRGFNKNDVFNYLFDVLDKLFENRKTIYGICVSINGQIDREKGISLNIPFIDGWDNIPVVSILQRRYKVPIIIQHDPDCILAYQKFITKNDEKNCVLLRIGEGIGISAMIRNKLYISSVDSGIEIEHAIMVPDGKPCKCGKRGCFGMYCSFSALRSSIEEKFNKKIAESELKGFLIENKDIEIDKIVDGFIKNIAYMCYDVLMLYNPQALYIEGAFNEISNNFEDRLSKSIASLSNDREYELFFIDFKKEIPPVGSIISSRSEWLKYTLTKIV